MVQLLFNYCELLLDTGVVISNCIQNAGFQAGKRRSVSYIAHNPKSFVLHQEKESTKPRNTTVWLYTKEVGMSLEPGGRAEKYGDEYENRYLARLLLRLVREELTSVIVEPVGENSDSVEFVAERKDGSQEYIQCKASNSTKASWSVSDLQKYKVFCRAKQILSGNERATYFFISPLAYNELDELCKRARSTPSAEALGQFQLTNRDIREAYSKSANAFGVDVGIDKERAVFVGLLSRCYFVRYPDGLEAVRDLEDLIGLLFTGTASKTRILLSQYANAMGRFGKPITPKDIMNYLEENEIFSRSIRFDERILPNIVSLNKRYLDSFSAINDNLIPRQATQTVMGIIHNGGCVIVHGKAGNGKSGCLQEVLHCLEDEQTLYLAVKLDKYSPAGSADEFGKKLGLPESPAFCLARLASGKPCVLVLDQLDALRWTSNHSMTALDVCKELIRQVDACNQHEGGKISVVFAARTFDLENDRGLKNLFGPTAKDRRITWERICVGAFSKEEVIQIVGEEYYTLSPRLQHLLLTPSSLYVWTQLNRGDQANSVSSVYQLMSDWWNQVLHSAAEKGLSITELCACKDMIVNTMERRSDLSLPLALFSDHTNAIEVLASSGMLKTNDKTVSFVHQSFFDYFITADSIRKIYDGIKVEELIAPYNAQIPQLRYRLISILQYLIEADQIEFINQSRTLLQSENVHFYFQCAVFEVLGQCEDPITEVFTFLDEYSANERWTSFVMKTVYWGHPVFVKHLAEQGCNMVEEHNITLLRSIARKAPDYVLNNLRKLDISDQDNARLAYGTIGYNVEEDSDELFQYRLELLNNHPNLLDAYVDYSHLYSSHPLRATLLLKVILENQKNYQFNRTYFGEQKKIDCFAAKNCRMITSVLVPVIAQKTAGFSVSWPTHSVFYDDNYREWVNSFSDNTVRKIVEIVKKSFAEVAIQYPEEACEYKHQELNSAVCHELFMHAICNLPVSYSDFAVQWLLDDFNARVFVFTNRQDDYLYAAKELIHRFSSSCSFEQYRQLEQVICTWSERAERMRNLYQNRIVANKTHTYYPIYSAFWGHMQKELLPYLDPNRLTTYSKELIAVLKRNRWVETGYFGSGFSVGPAKFVISPIEKKAARVSDKRWLKIISTPASKMEGHLHGLEDESSYIEANHQAFSDTLYRQAKLEPKRFASLSLHFPTSCYHGYIRGVLNAIWEADGKPDRIEFELLCQVIRHFFSDIYSDIATEITRIIRQRAEEPWPEDIIAWLKTIAVSHPDPRSDKFHITSSNDPEHLQVRSLRENGINCTRGCAVLAISYLLWEHAELTEQFKEIVSTACGDNNPAVRMEALSCLLPLYNHDKDYAIRELHRLLDYDLRIIGTHEFEKLLQVDYLNQPHYYCGKLIDACKSPVEDLSEQAAGLLCAVAIFFQDGEALHTLTTLSLCEKQQEEICKNAISFYNLPDYHERSKLVLLEFINKANNPIHSLGHLFSPDTISIERDSEFLVKLMRSAQGPTLIWQLLHYLDATEDDILNYSEVLKTISTMRKDAPQDGRLFYDMQSYVKCVIRLSDRGKGNPSIQAICIDIWDNLYQSDVQPAMTLSNMLDSYE